MKRRREKDFFKGLAEEDQAGTGMMTDEDVKPAVERKNSLAHSTVSQSATGPEILGSLSHSIEESGSGDFIAEAAAKILMELVRQETAEMTRIQSAPSSRAISKSEAAKQLKEKGIAGVFPRREVFGR